VSPEPFKICDIKHKMTNLYVVAKVIEIRDQAHPWKKHAIANISDGTGKIRMNLWRGQVEMVGEGDTIHMLNGFTEKKKGFLTLNTWEENILKSKKRKKKSKNPDA